MTKKFVYVGQYDAFWRLTPDEWEQICRDGMKGGYDLSPFKQLAGRPIWLKRHPDGSTGYYRTRQDMLYYEPLDWDAEDFREALDELEEMRNDGEIGN